MAKISGKTASWTTYSFSVSSSNYTNWECMLLMEQSHVHCNAHNLVLPEKHLKNKDFS